MSGRGEKFVWPPATGMPPPSSEHQGNVETIRSIPRATLGAKVREAIREAERVWLGLDAPPMDVRLKEAGWAPDEWTAYCRRCGATVGMHEADDTGCAACRGTRMPWERLVRLGAFTGVLRDMVLEVKFTRWRRLGHDLGRLLGESLAPVIEAEGISLERTVLVPVPISTVRRIRRGIDHAAVIARGAGSVLGVPVVSALRRNHGPAQSRLGARERLRNMRGVIRMRPGVDLGNLHVIVVDDVTTTRATLRAACRAILDGRKALGDKDWRLLAGVIGVTPGAREGGRG